MNWQDSGFLISKNKYSENSAIVEFYTSLRGKVTGILYGATSRKIKNYLLIGNKFHINFFSKNDNQVGYFKIEIEKVNTVKFLEDPIKLSCICYVVSMIKVLTVENQKNEEIYNLINDFYEIIDQDIWLANFVHWELAIFNKLGYLIDFKNYISDQKNDNEKYYLKNNKSRIIPNFLIDKNAAKSPEDLNLGLRIVGDFLEKSILKPNNLNPLTKRVEFINTIK